MRTGGDAGGGRNGGRNDRNRDRGGKARNKGNEVKKGKEKVILIFSLEIWIYVCNLE